MIAWTTMLAALAQVPPYDPPPMSVDRLRPSIDAARTVYVEDTALPRPWVARADIAVARDPLVWTDAAGERHAMIGTLAAVDLAAAVGEGRWRIGAHAPVYVVETGAWANGPALGDVVVDGRLVVREGGDAVREGGGAAGLAVLGRATLPTGGSRALVGWERPTTEIGIAADVAPGGLWLGANVGVRFVPRLAFGDQVVDDALWWRAGVARDVGESLTLALEAASEVNLGGGGAASLPTGLDLTARVRAGEAEVRIGAGAGLVAGIGQPAWRVRVGIARREPATVAP